MAQCHAWLPPKFPESEMTRKEAVVSCDRMSDAFAMLLALQIIAKIQDESRFFHFWRYWDDDGRRKPSTLPVRKARNRRTL